MSGFNPFHAPRNTWERFYRRSEGERIMPEGGGTAERTKDIGNIIGAGKT